MAVSGQDIGLLFGVLGGGRISGESGTLIKSQLDSIIASLNNATNSKQRRIKLNLDVAGTKSGFSTGLKQITDGLSGQKQFKIKVSEIDATSAINKLKTQLDAMLRTIKVDTGFTVTLGKNGASSAMKEIANDAKGAVLSIAEAEAALKEISVTNQSLTAGYKKAKEALGGEAATGDNIAALERLKQKYLELQTTFNTLSANKKQLSQDEVNQIYVIQAALQQLIAQTMERIAAENAVADAASKRAAAEEAAAEREKAASLDVIAMRKEAIALQKRMASALNNFSKASGTPWYQTISAGKSELDAMLSGAIALDRTKLNNLIDSFNASEGAIRAAGLATKSFGDSIIANAKKFTQWFGVSQIIMRIVSLLGDMVSAVRDVDTAMTELRKVTNETEATYTRFLENAAKRAKTLGATLSDTVTASADFARLGYSIDEAAELADAALVYKNVGDGIEDISTASESIISTMQAFNVKAEESMFIVDKFNEVGNNFAISSKGVGDALLRSASALAAGNNTLDESIGLITAANTVVQDADVVGTTMKTISMYLRAAKTEAEEAGESTDGMAESVSELRSEILSLTGGKVDIQIDENTFKSTYQIIKELSEVWGELTDITQANILEMIGGKRNSNVVSALLNNFALAEDVVKTSAEAAGSALAENEKYLDSIEGRISVFSATFEEMSTNVIDSELVKNVVDLGTALVSVVGGLAKVDMLFPSIIAACVTIKSFKMAQSAAQLAAQEEAASASLVSRLLAEKTTNDNLIVSYQTLSVAQQKSVLEKLQAVAGTEALSQAQYELISKNLALAVSTESATAATNKLNISIKSLLASNPIGWIMLAVSLLPGLVSWIQSLHKSIDELDEEYDELATTISNTASSFSSFKESADQTIPRFIELSKGVDEFCRNVELTDEEYEEFLTLNNQIAEMFPELDMGFDSNGNHILALSMSVDTLTESLNALVEAERQAANSEIASNLGDALKNLKSSDKVYSKELKALQDRKDAYNEAYSEINRMYAEQDKYQEAYGERWQEVYELDTSNYVTQMQQAFGTIGDAVDAEAWQRMIAPFTDPDDEFKIDWHGVINSEEFTSAMAALDRQIDAQEQKREARWQKLNPIMGAWLQTTDEYSSSTEDVQAVLNKVIGNIDYSEIGITNEKKLQAYVTDNFVKPIYEAKPEVQNALVGLYDIKSAFDSGALTVGEYGITDYILGDLKEAGLSDELLSNVELSLGLDDFREQVAFVKSGLQEVRSDYSDTVAYYNQVQTEIKAKNIDTSKTLFGNIDTNARQVLEWTNESLAEYKDALMSWADEADSWENIKAQYLGSYSTVDGRSEEFSGIEIAFTPILQTENGAEYLTSGTVHSYIEQLLEKANADGSWTDEELLLLDAEGLEIDGQRIKNLIAGIGDEAIKTGEAMHYVGEDGALNGTYKELEQIADELGVSVNDLLIQFSSVDEYINSLSASDLKIAYEIIEQEGSLTVYELQEKLRELRYESANMVTPLDFSSMVSGLEETADGIDKIVSAMEKLAEGTALSKSELMDLVSQYPALLEQANLFADGSVEAQRNALNAILGLKEDEYDAQIDAKIAELKATQQVLEDQLALEEQKANLINEIKNLEVNGKIEQEEDFVNKLSEYNDLQGENYVSLADGELQVNEEALNDKLAQEYDYGEKATDNIWEPLGETIVTAHEQGYTGALTATNNYTTSLWQRIKDWFSNIGSAISTAWKDMWAGEWQGIDTYFGMVSGTGTGQVSGGTITVNFGGSETTVNGENVSEWISKQEEATEKRVKQIEEIKAKTLNAINNLESLKGLNLTELYASNSSGGSSNSGNEVEAYVADIEKYREALERLNDVRIKKADLELELENAEDLDEQIRIEKELLGVYRAEQECLEEINGLRDETIANGVKALEQLGFQIDYDPDSNKFFVKNLEHLNELTADSVGEYGSLQEATNALRKDTEELIDTLEELNTENQEDQDTWQELYHTIREAKINIVNNLKEIVSQASEAVDEIQNVYDTLKDAADEYAANGGFISVDAFQAIVDLGPEYMQYLRDENGLLVINEEAINRVIAAKTEQLALESAMSYIERLRLALQDESIEDLNTLLYATVESTNATWGLVYANLALLDLNSDQYQAALQNINAIRALADSAIQGIGQTAGTVEENLNEMKQGLDDILQYVMDMLRHRIEQQIDALEEMKDAYAELIELKKESMEATKKETDYQDEVAEKIKQIAKLQERINALSLDDSRDAQAQKAQLQEEMAELQKELADTQADYAYDTQQDSLDKMQDAYETEKDKEIDILEESISSEQKLYDMAISYIQDNWDTLYQELIAWNTEYGSVLNSEITTAWDNCLAAAQRYGSYVSALNSIDADIESAGGSSNNITVGSTNYDNSSSKEESIEAIISEMWRNSNAHHSASTEQKAYLNKRNLTLGAMLAQYGITAVRGDDGVWYIDRVGGQQLYDKYKEYCYHTGGIVGDEGTLKENEVLAKLERGEVMISNQSKGTLFSLIEFVELLSKKLDVASAGMMERPFIKDAKPDLSNITNNQSETIHFGDVYIYGSDEQTVEKHREVTRQFTNEVLKQLNIKR